MLGFLCIATCEFGVAYKVDFGVGLYRRSDFFAYRVDLVLSIKKCKLVLPVKWIGVAFRVDWRSLYSGLV